MAHKCFPYEWERMLACFDKTARDSPFWGRAVCESMPGCSVCISVWIHRSIVHCTNNISVLSYLQQIGPLFLILALPMALLSKLLYLYVIFSPVQGTYWWEWSATGGGESNTLNAVITHTGQIMYEGGGRRADVRLTGLLKGLRQQLYERSALVCLAMSNIN